MKKMSWFRLYADIVDDEIMQFLSFEDQRHFVWVLALKCAGILDKEYPIENMLETIVARKLGLRGEAFSNAKIRLVKVGLIDVNWQPLNWNKRQFISDQDASNAARQRKYREKQKLKTNNVTHNVTVTPPDTEADTDTEHNPSGYSSAESADACPHQAIIALYHEVCTALPKVRSWTTGRSANLRQRWRESKRRQSLDWWRNFFEVVAASDFLCGRVQNGQRKPFVADLGWLVKPENFAKILEGKYDNG